jgi:hypothetical protein
VAARATAANASLLAAGNFRAIMSSPAAGPPLSDPQPV